MENPSQPSPDLERQIELDFLRATEIAALNTLQWLGKGEKEKADEAACDAIRSGTVRFIEAHHNLERKTVHLRSSQAERTV